MIQFSFTKRALDDAQEHVDFWGDTFKRGLRAALAHLQRLPRGGQRWPHRLYPDCIRVRVKGTKSYLYYVYDDKSQVVTVLTVWCQSRGKGPFDR